MATVYEIAAHISARLGGVDRYKLHKLVYYVQAWSLVWRKRAAFEGRIEAWKHGPVAPSLQTEMVHRASDSILRANSLPPEEAAHVDRVLVYYGHMSADQLIKLTHEEEPWSNARAGLAPTEPSSNEITKEAMQAFYAKRWLEADEDNSAIESTPAFVGSVDELERFLDCK
jgi:uncharacterized phage-associated protein